MPQQQVNGGDLVEISVWQTYDLSRLMNIYHYQVEEGIAPIVNGDDFLYACCDEVWNNLYNASGVIRDHTVSALRYDFIRAQVVNPGRNYYVPYIVGQNGAVLGTPGCPSDVQLCMTYRANRVGRGVNGRKAYGGIPNSAYSASLWQAGVLNDWNTIIAPVLKNPLTVLGKTFTPKIWNPRRPSQMSDIAVVIAQQEVRVQRRRQFRLGI